MSSVLKSLAGATALALAASIATDCSPAGSHFKIKNVTVVPDPPVQGSPAIMAAAGAVDEAITGGDTTLSVVLSGFPLYNAPATTCGNTTISLPLGMGSVYVYGFDCPTVVGEAQNISLSLTLPQGIPSGVYNIILSGNDQNKAPVFCVNGTFNE